MNPTPIPKKSSYKHKSYRCRPAVLSKVDWKNLKILFLSFLGITLILAFLYLFAVMFLSNIDLFWRILRPGSPGVIEKQDKVPPPPPYLQAPPKATNKPLAVSGFSEPGANVTLFLNNSKVKEVVVDSEGGFSFEEVVLFEGENKIYAKAVDSAGNESKKSSEYIVIYDKTPPKLEIEAPTSGTKIEKEEERQIEIKGLTEANSQVTINGFWARVDDEGKFSYNLRLEEGENKIEILAKDEAGNETKKEISVSYEPSEEDEEE